MTTILLLIKRCQIILGCMRQRFKLRRGKLLFPNSWYHLSILQSNDTYYTLFGSYTTSVRIYHFRNGSDCAGAEMVGPLVASPRNVELPSFSGSWVRHALSNRPTITDRAPRTGLGFFAWKPFPNMALTGYYYGSMVYGNRCGGTE